MKALNPTLERLEERIAPGLIIGIDLNIGLGIGGGTSACNNSVSRGYCSTQGTVSQSCNCGNNSH